MQICLVYDTGYARLRTNFTEICCWCFGGYDHVHLHISYMSTLADEHPVSIRFANAGRQCAICRSLALTEPIRIFLAIRRLCVCLRACVCDCRFLSRLCTQQLLPALPHTDCVFVLVSSIVFIFKYHSQTMDYHHYANRVAI